MNEYHKRIFNLRKNLNKVSKQKIIDLCIFASGKFEALEEFNETLMEELNNK